MFAAHNVCARPKQKPRPDETGVLSGLLCVNCAGNASPLLAHMPAARDRFVPLCNKDRARETDTARAGMLPAPGRRASGHARTAPGDQLDMISLPLPACSSA